MNAHVRLFGLYVPGSTPVHRLPVWAKYFLMLGGGLAPFLIGDLVVSLVTLIVAVVLLAGVARLPARIALSLPWAFWLVMAVLVCYHLLFTTWLQGALYVVNLLVALYLARLVTMTTPVADLMDAVAAGARPLRLVGANPEKIALALALMWRSIPYLLGSIGDVRAAARARGLERSALRFALPIIVSAVGHALATADALRARGLDERTDAGAR